MKIGDWKTRSVFERYAIVSQSDIREAMSALQTGQQREKAKVAREQKAQRKQFGQGLGRIEPERSEIEGSILPMVDPVN